MSPRRELRFPLKALSAGAVVSAGMLWEFRQTATSLPQSERPLESLVAVVLHVRLCHHDRAACQRLTDSTGLYSDSSGPSDLAEGLC